MTGLDISTLSVFLALLVAAGGGLISFLSPCVLPLVPSYLCFIAGTNLEEIAQSGEQRLLKKRVLISALSFVLGFTTIFVLLGASASALNPILLTNQGLFAKIAGSLIVILGLHFMGLFKFKFLQRELRFNPSVMIATNSKAGYLIGPYVIGLAFAFGWTPCIGPILAAILPLAATQDTLAYGMSLLASYSLGLGIPFLIAALAIERFVHFMTRFRQHLGKVEFIAGGFLVFTGILIFTDALSQIAIFMLDLFPALASFG